MQSTNEHAAKRKLIGEALADLVASARTGGPKVRIGLMVAGSELGLGEFLRGAEQAMAQDARLQVVAIGPRPGAGVIVPEQLEWIETPDCETDVAQAMEKALASGELAGTVALHYPFPMGVTTIGRVVTPGRGRAMIVASSTGTSSTHRPEAMLRNAIYGVAVAKALGIAKPTVGILNLDSASPVQRALAKLKEQGYPVTFGSSVRADGGALLRGNDLLAGAVDVCVCDTLTGNVLMKLFAAYTTGGAYEALGWGYGPSVGEGWPHVVSIISRASGAPVIAGALSYTAAVVRGKLPERVAAELAAAKKAGFDDIIAAMAPKPACVETVAAPPTVPTDEEIHGIDVLDIERAVQELWKAGIYAESAMGCTGPVVKIPGVTKTKATEILKQAGFA